jgi:hypothetical protein
VLTTGIAALRSGTNKLTVAFDAAEACLRTELYDLATDPLEAANIAVSQRATVSTLRGVLSGMSIPWMAGYAWCR